MSKITINKAIADIDIIGTIIPYIELGGECAGYSFRNTGIKKDPVKRVLFLSIRPSLPFLFY